MEEGPTTSTVGSKSSSILSLTNPDGKPRCPPPCAALAQGARPAQGPCLMCPARWSPPLSPAHRGQFRLRPHRPGQSEGQQAGEAGRLGRDQPCRPHRRRAKNRQSLPTSKQTAATARAATQRHDAPPARGRPGWRRLRDRRDGRSFRSDIPAAQWDYSARARSDGRKAAARHSFEWKAA